MGMTTELLEVLEACVEFTSERSGTEEGGEVDVDGLGPKGRM